MRALPLLALLAACGPSEDPPPAPMHGYDYSPTFGDRFVLVDPEDEEGTEPMLLFVGNNTWEFLRGDDFTTATSVATYTVEVGSDGIVFDGHVVLPGDFRDGESWDNGTIVGVQEEAVAIGKYEEVVLTEVDAGPLAGPGAWVEGVGAVRLTLDGFTWEVNETIFE